MFKFKTAVQSALNILLTHIKCGKSHALVGVALSLGCSLALSQAAYGSGGVSIAPVTLPPEQMGEFFNREERRRAQEACNAATRSWSEVGRRFGTACSEANLNQGGNQSQGHINCSLEVQRCMHCPVGDTDSSWIRNFNCDEGETRISSRRESSGVAEGVLRGVAGALTGEITSENREQSAKIKQQRRRFEYCPAKAAEELDKQIEDTRKSRERMQKQEDDLLKLQERYDKAKQEGEQKLQDMTEQIQDLGVQYQEQAQALKERLEEQENKLAEQVIELEGKLQEAQQAMRSLNLAREQAHNEYLDGRAELERACHSQALAHVAEWHKARREKIARNTHGGNMGDLFSRANVSLVQQAESRAQQHYRSCVRDQGFTSRREGLQRQRNAKLNQLNQQERALVQAQRSITDAIRRLQTETRSRILQQNIQEMERLISNYQRSHERLATAFMREQLQLQQNLARMSQEMQLAQTRLAAARMEYFELESLTELRKSLAPGGSTKAGAVAKATAELGNLASEARIVWSACRCSDGNGDREHELDRTQCQRVGEFLKANFNESLSPYRAPATDGSGSSSTQTTH